MLQRLNAYRIMWLFVFYDLPMVTPTEVRRYNRFRKTILKDGFNIFQFSAYIRHCSSAENAQVHKQRVIDNLPEDGHIGILQITDKQFEQMEIYYKKKPEKKPQTVVQLELF